MNFPSLFSIPLKRKGKPKQIYDTVLYFFTLSNSKNDASFTNQSLLINNTSGDMLLYSGTINFLTALEH